MSPSVLGVLAGNDMPLEQLADICARFDTILAADGAVNQLQSIGIRPDAVIGDFDSSTPQARQSATEIHFADDQSATDCDKLLAYAKAQRFDKVTLANVEGDRPDHFLSTLSSVVKSPLSIEITFRVGTGHIIRSGIPAVVATRIGQTISLLPLVACVGVSLQGVEWPLDHADLTVGRAISISNRATADSVHVEIERGTALLFLIEGA
jgi:thiamine pyrophosphokinase